MDQSNCFRKVIDIHLLARCYVKNSDFLTELLSNVFRFQAENVGNTGIRGLEIIGFMDSFNFEKMYSYSIFFNVFVFGSPKIKSIRIRGDIGISQYHDNFAIYHVVYTTYT